MTETVRLYDALYNGRSDIGGIISALRELYYKMDGYYVPLASNTFVKTMSCQSALERAQLAKTVEACLALYG